MEYRGIRYTIRKRIERDEWFVAIHPDGVELRGKVIVGMSRREADLEAHSMINDWARRHPYDTIRNEPCIEIGPYRSELRILAKNFRRPKARAVRDRVRYYRGAVARYEKAFASEERNRQEHTRRTLGE